MYATVSYISLDLLYIHNGDEPSENYVPGVDSASNRDEYQAYFLGGKGGRCVGLTTLPRSCADSLEI